MTQEASPQVKYARNLDQVNMSTDELMSVPLSTDLLYTQIRVGTEAQQFFTKTILGADFDRKLRGQFADAFSALLEASPADAAAVADAQAECRSIIRVYELFDRAIREGGEAKQMMTQRDSAEYNPNDDQPGE